MRIPSKALVVFFMALVIAATSAAANDATSFTSSRVMTRVFANSGEPCATPPSAPSLAVTARTAPPRPSAVNPLAAATAFTAQDAGQPLHAAAVEHSDAYRTRAKIHKIASFATLPLFATEVALGQSLYNSNASFRDSKKSAHIAAGTSIIGLFAVNTVTGAWNLFGEDRQETKGRTLRLVHGLLMMAAEGGFMATSATGPGGEERRGTLTVGANAATHRAIAFTSIGVGTVGYLVMLIGNH